MKRFHTLRGERADVMLRAGTEPPGSGKYLDNKEEGIYLCAQCDLPLFLSSSKLESRCGWMGFDEAIENSIIERPDLDRTETLCSRCSGHLGHVFDGEGFTKTNRRYCINSIALEFTLGKNKACFGAGCFWGVQKEFKKIQGIHSSCVGFMGGAVVDPTYEEVCKHDTGHAEVVFLEYDPNTLSYEDLLKAFFQIHDPTQKDRQGPDVGSQYRSVCFYYSLEQKLLAEEFIQNLKQRGADIQTDIAPASLFYKASDEHQDYY